MGTYEQKYGKVTCFQKTSKNGKIYYSGSLKLNEKNFNVAIFEKVTVKGDKFLSVIVDEWKKKEENKEQKPVEEKNSFDFFDDDIPF